MFEANRNFQVSTSYYHFTNGVRTTKPTTDPADRKTVFSVGFCNDTLSSPRLVGQRKPSLRNLSPTVSKGFSQGFSSKESRPGLRVMETFVHTVFTSPG